MIWIYFSCGLLVPVWGNRGVRSMDNSVQMVEWNVKFQAQRVKGFSAWLYILYQFVHIAAKSQNADKKFFVGFMMTALWLTVMFTWKEEGIRASCFGHIVRKRYSENPLSDCVFKHQLGLENEFWTSALPSLWHESGDIYLTL